MEKKRLFYGLKVDAPWPEHFPEGRLLEAQHRHLTLAFLGERELTSTLEEIPLPRFNLGFIAQFEQVLFLPPSHPRVVAWQLSFLEEKAPLLSYREELLHYLAKQKIPVKEHKEFLPHVTISRPPFVKSVWKKAFTPLPCLLTDLTLFISLGHSRYKALSTWPLLPPFEEIEHTADYAFLIRGYNLAHLFLSAQAALAHLFPPLLGFWKKEENFTSLDEVITSLAHLISEVDSTIGCPCKGISYHGEIKEKTTHIEWEMIVDV